jgi:hypothetical protein
LLSKSTQQLKALAKKLGSSIEKSRPYYDAFEEYKTAQERCQEAAVQFQRAFGKQHIISLHHLFHGSLCVALKVFTKLLKKQ